jgi:putative MATE family efflux protein
MMLHMLDWLKRKPRKPKQVRIALDDVPFGPEGVREERKVKEIPLPEGVSSGTMYKDVARLAWPSLVELTLTQLASMVDLMMVGNLGAWALTSIGLTNQPKMMLCTVYQALNVGATAMVARYKGAGQQEKAREILRIALFINLFLSLICATVGYVFAEPLVAFMGAQETATLVGGTQYLQIQMIGLPFLALTFTITGALRGAGNSRTAMIYNTLANGVNVVLNWLLIEGHMGFPRLEVVGASLATIIACCIRSRVRAT